MLKKQVELPSIVNSFSYRWYQFVYV